MGIKDSLVKTYIRQKKMRKHTDPLIPKARTTKQKASEFIQRRSVKGRKQIVEPILKDIKKITGVKRKKNRRKKR